MGGMEITSSSTDPFELASRQHGIVAAWQLEPGVASNRLRYELEQSGRWARVHPQVFRLVGAPATRFTVIAGDCSRLVQVPISPTTQRRTSGAGYLHHQHAAIYVENGDPTVEMSLRW